MGPAKYCPAKNLGFCQLGKRCYATKAERLYKNVLPYRLRQHKYWLESTANGIAADFGLMLHKIKVPIKYLRFNEAGDFFGQDDVHKLSLVAEYLKREHQITTYGYTARQDLDFSDVFFLVKGSSHGNGNNGKTIVMKKNLIPDHLSTLPRNERKKWVVCPMSCKACDICKIKTGENIIFPLH
jgi:hypothetical protein